MQKIMMSQRYTTIYFSLYRRNVHTHNQKHADLDRIVLLGKGDKWREPACGNSIASLELLCEREQHANVTLRDSCLVSL
jgi:hypothetical protein